MPKVRVQHYVEVLRARFSANYRVAVGENDFVVKQEVTGLAEGDGGGVRLRV